MKNLTQLVFLFFTLFTFSKGFAQANFIDFPFARIYLHKKEYVSAEITFNDGTIKNVLIENLFDPMRYSFQGFNSDMMDVENTTLARKKVKIKDSDIEKAYDIETNTIKELVIFNGDSAPARFERLKIKDINNKLDAVYKDREILAPVLRKGKLNLYALPIKFEGSGSSPKQLSAFPVVYVKNSDDEFAYKPIDISLKTIFSIGKLDDKFIRAFELAGSECPEFIEYLQEEKEAMNSRSFRENGKVKFEDHVESKKAQGKKLSKSEREDLYFEMDLEYSLEMYRSIFDKYEELCE